MNKSGTSRVLMIVFGKTKYDGRVLRSAEALSKQYEVTLVGLGDCSIRPSVPIRYIEVQISHNQGWLCHALFIIKTGLIGFRVRPDIVHAHDYFLALHGWVISRVTGATCVYDAHEFFPGIKERSRLRHWLFQLLERISIKRYDLVIATSEERAQAIKDHYGLPELPIVVNNFAGLEEKILDSCQDDQNTSLDLQAALQHGLPLVVYQGYMDVPSRCLDSLLQAFTKLRGKCALIMVGDGPDLDYLQKLAGDLGIKEHTLFTGRLSKSQLKSIMRAASVGVVIYSNKSVNNLLCTPNKIHEYARANLAIVASNQLPLETMLHTQSIGEIFDPDEPISIQQAILKVLSNLESYETRIPEFLAHYSWDNEKRKLLDAYRSFELK